MFSKGNKKTIIAIGLAALLILSTAGCGSPSSSGSAKDPIKIGMVEPLSGSSAYDGKNVQQGAQLYIDELNNKGGLLGAKVQLLVQDTATDPATAVSAAQKLISNDNVVAMLGAYNSSSTGAVAPVTEKAGIPFLTSVSTSLSLTEQGYKQFFRMNGTSKLFADAFIQKIMEQLNVKNIAFIYENGDWGRNSMQAFSDAVKAAGGTVTTVQVINEGDQDIYTQMTAIKDTHPDAICASANTANAIRIANTAKELGLTPNVKLFGEGGWTSPSFLDKTKENAEGIYGIVEYTDQVDSDLNKTFVAAYKAKYNATPDKSAAAGYRAAQAMTAAIAKAGSTDAQKITDAMRQLSVDTTTGTYTFDEKGQAHGFNMYLAQIKNGVPTIAMTAQIK